MIERTFSFKGAHEYQELAAKFAYDRPYCCLFMDMGMGKTVTTLSLIDRLIYEDMEVRKVLIVAPLKVAKMTWTDELEKWPHLARLRAVRVLGTEKQRREALGRDADIYLINRENLAWLVSEVQSSVRARKATWPFDMVVLDELSSYKNHKSVRFKFFRLVRPQCARVIGLTGTPAPNGYMDLWAQLYCIDRGKALGQGLTKYRYDHFDAGQRNGSVVFNWTMKKGHERIIAKALEETCLTLRAKDYLDTPHFTRNTVFVEMPFDVAKQYKDFERDQIIRLRDSGEEITAMTAGALRCKLLQFANGAVYMNGEEYVAGEAREWKVFHEEKLNALEDILEESQGKPVFVAWAYKHDRDRIIKRFGKRGIVQFDGKNDEAVKAAWNRGEIPILLTHPASVAYGLNLQDGGSTIVWFGMTDSLELYQQFNARLERQGQKCAGFIHHIVTKDTEDETMLPRMDGKTSTQDDFLARLIKKMKSFS